MPLELNFVGLMYETRDSSMSQLGLSERGLERFRSTSPRLLFRGKDKAKDQHRSCLVAD